MRDTNFFFLIKVSLVSFFCLFCLQSLEAQNAKTVTGTVTDETNEPLPGVTVVLKSTTGGVLSDADGKFTISVAEGNTLVFSYLGMQPQEVVIDSRNVYNIKLEALANELDDVTVVAFAKQKKESVISAITTVNPQDLKVPSSNLTTALAGRMAGLIAFQKSGEPGRDNAQFFIRGVTTFGYKKDPLILIDNIELTTDDLARLNVDDIAQFSIMKDATATALYGARGANGVIIVTTKEGKAGKPKISVRYENSISTPRKMVEMADPITYMRLNNEAVNTRRDLTKPSNYDNVLFSQEKIENTIAGTNPYVYPAVDWYDELFRDHALSQRVNMNLSGGGTSVRYYVAASYTKDGGVIKNDKLNNYNSDINLQRYSVRSNTNIDLSKSTEFVIRVNGNFDDYSGPIDTGDDLFRKVMNASPVLYPKSYPAVGDRANATHILFGGTSQRQFINPYADMVRGYKEYNRTSINAQAELKQKFDFITEGLEARVMVSTSRYSYSDVKRHNKPFYYEIQSYDRPTNTYELMSVSNGEEHLTYEEGGKEMKTTNYIEAALSYNRTFDKHAVSGMLVFTRQDEKISNAGSFQLSLPRRNQGLAGRFTYAFDSKYFTEFNFGYNGSERFAAHERYGFFPSVGAGYIISNEPFWEPWAKTVDKLKFKLTYGLVGNDAIGKPEDRFYYLSEVNMEAEDRRQYFGTNYGVGPNGISNTRYPNPYITWEKSKKTNFGIELGMFNSALEIQADLFYEYRTNIYQGRSYIPSSMGLSAGVYANIGEASSRGIDISASYSYISPKDFWVRGMANFTYARGKYEVYEEPDYDGFGEPWRSRIGNPINGNYGYIAERLFIDENDILNSPSQAAFAGGAMAGDIKYKDINNDGKITEADRVHMGFPYDPEITYGFGASAGYKDFDLNLFFQGNARVSFFLEPNKIMPFITEDPNERPNEIHNLLAVIANDHWSEDNRNPYAFWPRLSPSITHNNTQSSTWWLHDASFLRLKTVELGYSLPKKLIRGLKMESVRLYFTGNNLLTFSPFKLWDPEMGNNGLGYPIQKTYNIGVNINF